jgi:hypothetical protein
MGSLLTHETRLHLEDESITNAFKTQFSFSRGRGRGRVEVTKEEGEVQVTITKVKVTNNRTRIIISKVTDNITRIRISSLKEVEGEDQMKNRTYNSITTKIMDTLDLNSRRSKKIISQEEHMTQIMKEKPQMVCFSYATRLNNNIKISGFSTVVATITWKVTKIYSHALILLFHLILHLEMIP